MEEGKSKKNFLYKITIDTFLVIDLLTDYLRGVQK